MFLTCVSCYNFNMNTVRVLAPAKLNLTLEIVGSAGGYHLLDSIVATIDLADEVTVAARTDGAVNFSMGGADGAVIEYERNTAVRAAQLFTKKFAAGGADIFVQKNIPFAAGLGGSSADAAGVIRAMCALYGVDLSAAAPIADEVGSDVRYLLTGGFARMCGRGNKIYPINSGLSLDFLIIVPPRGVSTAECYARYDQMPKGARGFSDRAALALTYADKSALCANFYNALYNPARSLCPEVEQALGDALSLDPMGAAMSGSGSAVFAAFADSEQCRLAQARYKGGGLALCAATYTPIDGGKNG